VKSLKEGQSPSEQFFPFFLALLFFLLAFFPDEKLLRPKLLVLEMGLFVALFFWCGRVLWRGELRLAHSPVLLAVVPWFLFIGILTLVGDDPALARGEWRRTLLMVSAFFVASQGLTSSAARRTVWRGWGAGCGLISLYALLQRSGGLGPIQVPQMARVMGTFGNPIFLGTYLSLSLPLILALAHRASSRLEKMGWVLASFTTLLALIFTHTRAAWLGVGAALIVAIIVLMYGRRKFWTFFLMGIFIGGLFVWGTRNVWLRDQGHLLIWRDTLKIWKSHPLVGVGPGEFHIHFPAAAGEDLRAKWPQQKVIINYAHNEYLQVMAESGIMGLVLWLSPFFFFYKRFLQSKTKSTEELALACAVTAGLVQAVFSVDLRFSISAGILFFLLGSGVPSGTGVWEKRWTPTPIKRLVGMGLLVLASGLLALEKSSSGPRLNLLGFYQLAYSDHGLKGEVFPEGMHAGLLTRLLHPYAAQHRQSHTPGFFEERLLDPAKTLEDLEALAEAYPQEPTVFEKLGYAYAKEIQSYDAQGKKVIHRNIAEKALAAFTRTTELDPSRPGPLNNIGNIYFTLGDRSKAMDYWRRSLRVDPDQRDARLNLGKVYYLKGRLKESAEQFRHVLRLDPGNDDATVYLKRMVE